MSDEERSTRVVSAAEIETDEQRSSGAGLLYDYFEPLLDGPAEKDPVLAVEMERHLACHVGPVEEVFHEAFSEVVEVEILRVEPTDERPFHILTTCGMAQRAMTVPNGLADWSFAELVLALPPDWCFDDAAVEGDAGWPIRLLQDLARFPHQYGTWLGLDHSVPNGEPPESYAPDTNLCGCLLEVPAYLPDTFRRLDLSDGRSLHFLHVTPLFADEIDYKLTVGTDSLLKRFDDLRMPMVVDPERPCVVNPDHPGAMSTGRSAVRGVPWWRQAM